MLHSTLSYIAAV